MFKVSAPRNDPKRKKYLSEIKKGQIICYGPTAYHCSLLGYYFICDLSKPKLERRWKQVSKEEYLNEYVV